MFDDIDTDPTLRIQAGNMHAALSSYYSRTHDSPVCVDMPFDEALKAESDGLDGEPGEYEMAQRRAAIRGAFRYLTAEGPNPLKIMKRLYALGRGLHIEPFQSMTMEESGMMFSETKAAHSWRMKYLSGLIHRSGQKGVRLPGQKSPGASASYAECQKGNQNRKGTKRSRGAAESAERGAKG